MIDEITLGSSLAQTLVEARKSGVPEDEARKVFDLVTANTSPEVVHSNFIENFAVRWAELAQGKSLLVTLFVDKDLGRSKEAVSEITNIANRLHTALLEGDFRYWPYIEFSGR
jgi:hypothetical protein